MYCKNCGHEIDNKAAVCAMCGFAKGSGDKFCSNCQSPLIKDADFCTSCGTKIEQAPIFEGKVKNTGKSKIAAGIFGILLDSLGIHNFYLGYTGKGILQLLLSVLSCGTLSFVSAIWGLIEGILILTGSINTDAQGNPLAE